MAAALPLLTPPAHPPTACCCRRGGNAPPHFVLTHYPEMVADKGLVLVRGDIVAPVAVSRGEVCRPAGGVWAGV